MQRLLLATLTLLTALVSACVEAPTTPPPDGGPPPGDPVLARLALSAPATSLDPTAVMDITVAAFDQDDTPIAVPVLAWASSDPAVIAVSQSGEVLARTAGTARITATHGAITAGIDLNVRPMASIVDRLEIGPIEGGVLSVGGSTQLVATAYDAADNVVPGRTITWWSNDAAAGTSATGLVTANAPGLATIIATCDGVTATIPVRVKAPVARVAITAGPTLALRPSMTRQLAAIAYAANDSVLDGRELTWAIADASVATISDDGLVTAHALGTTTATATVEGVIAEFAITVRDVARIELNHATATIDLVEQLQLHAQLFDADDQPIDDYLIWTSDHPEIAAVDGAGLVTGLAEGGAIITATNATGSATATVLIFVAPWLERALVSVDGAPAPATLYDYGTTPALRMVADDGVFAMRALDGRYELMVFGPVFVDGVESGYHAHASAGTMTWNAVTARFDLVPDAGFGAPFTGRYVGNTFEVIYQPDAQGAPATLVFGS